MLNASSLREQVYLYLRNEIQTGNLLPGASINLDKLSRELGISKTPLKEAIIKLECEGFVKALPRKGIMVKKLVYQELKDYYEILGSLEAGIVLSVFEQFSVENIEEMKASNAEQEKALVDEEFDRYYQLNLDFHDIFLKQSDNLTLREYIMPLKQRLYDFPRQKYWKEWEQVNLDEHCRFIASIEKGDKQGAASIIKDEHWGWKKHEPYFIKFYKFDE